MSYRTCGERRRFPFLGWRVLNPGVEGLESGGGEDSPEYLLGHIGALEMYLRLLAGLRRGLWVWLVPGG